MKPLKHNQAVICFTTEYAKKPQRTQVISDYVTTEDAKKSQRARRKILFYYRERKGGTENAKDFLILMSLIKYQT